MPSLHPQYRGEFCRWVVLCKGAGRKARERFAKELHLNP